MNIIKLTAEQTWPIRHEVMWPDKPLDYVILPNDSSGNHYGLEVDKKIVSIISLFENKGEIQFRKFATLLDEQGKGYGSYLLSNVLKESTTKSVKSIWCNARLDKAGYYKKFGLSATTEKFSKGGIDYIIMKKVVGQ